MSGLVEFLRDRYSEAQKRERAKRRTIPSPFDGHAVEICYSSEEGQQVIVDGHPYPAEKYFEIATEPAPDPAALADLDAKQKILQTYERWQSRADAGEELSQFERGSLAQMYAVCRMLAEAEGWKP